MADSPPETALKKAVTNKTKASSLPHSSRYPSLISGQVSFTTAAAIRDLTQVPTHVYRIQVDLKPRTKESNFTKDPWTLVARHFFASLLSFDEKAIILKKKENAPVNKLSSPEELPDNPELFERDYAYDVNHRGPRLVSFKLIIATTKNFWNTFKNPTTFYKKLLSNEWYVRLIRLENQGTSTEIGHLLYGHTRFLNQDDIINEIKTLIRPTICNDIDIRTTKTKEVYYDDDGKKQEVITKWPSIFCPIDIAGKLSTILMEKWDNVERDKNEGTYNLRQLVFVPKDRDLVNFDARIANMAKQNEFLSKYREITVLSNCPDITANFTYTEEVVKALGHKEQLGHILSLREFLGTWQDQSTGNPAIYSISKTTRNDEYALLTGSQHSQDIHTRIDCLVNAIRHQATFKNIRIGGTRGAMGKKRFSESVHNYAKKRFTTEKKYNQRPPTSNEKQHTQEEWRKPPQERRQQKPSTPSLTINHNDQRQRQQYSDVIKGPSTTINNNGAQMSISNTTGTISLGNTNGNHTFVSDNTAAIEGKNKGNKIVTKTQINHILESREFQDTLAKIVAPQVAKQVTDLISPSVEKLDSIEAQVNELHHYVNDNKQWQKSQSNRQTAFQTNMNCMTTTMNDMGGKIDKLVGLFQSNSLEENNNMQGKRPADSLSPDHTAKMDNKHSQKAKTQHKYIGDGTTTIKDKDNTNITAGLTSPLSKLNNLTTQPNESDDEMNSPRKGFEEVGKGQ